MSLESVKVSIVIPCYNHARFLSDAIESALAQGRSDCEVIVVDDGSTDESSEVARRYPDVRVIRQPNQGLSAARNAGLAASRGDYMIFLDADDRLRSNAAQIAVDSLTAHPNAAMVFGLCQVVNEVGEPTRTNLTSVRSNFYETLLRGNFIWMPAMAAFRRSVFERVGPFDRAVSPAADYDMYLRIARGFPIVKHDAVVADYRQHGGNMSADPVLMLDTTLEVLRGQQAHVAQSVYLDRAYREGLKNWRALYGERLVDRFRLSLRTGNLSKAARELFHLFRLYPSGVRHHTIKKMLLSLRGPRNAGGGDRLGQMFRF